MPHLAELKTNAEKIKKSVTVLTASYFPKHSSKVFAKSIDARFISLPTNVGENEVDSYFKLLDHIVRELSK